MFGYSTCADPKGRGGGQGVRTPLENHKLLYISLEILVRIPLEKQFDPSGPTASWGRSVWPSVKYNDDYKKVFRTPPDEFFWIGPWNRFLTLNEETLFYHTKKYCRTP